MVTKKIATRDYLRAFITKANKEAGVTFNAAKLSSKDECEEYLLNLIKNLRHKKQDNKAYIKEIDDLKEEMEILKKDNNNLAAQNRNRDFLFKLANETTGDYFNEKLKHHTTKKKVKECKKIIYSLLTISVIEAISIAMLLWK
ncbi:hypothetical protein ABVN59_05265 [Fusobacterium vincentii]|uniref:hypothetical protein n=1 Tax=Fusobacterium TaxID=848 RepID=UPI0003B87928|nr:hypothetical protein [Fusobacterium nucleatum]ERT44804.1 hypothetical protein HMPREF1768_01751 [Fusobacterium nucleatum CTI-7]